MTAAEQCCRRLTSGIHALRDDVQSGWVAILRLKGYPIEWSFSVVLLNRKSLPHCITPFSIFS